MRQYQLDQVKGKDDMDTARFQDRDSAYEAEWIDGAKYRTLQELDVSINPYQPDVVTGLWYQSDPNGEWIELG